MAKKIPNQMKRNPRFLAMQSLLSIREGGFSNLVVTETLNHWRLEEKDKGLYTEIVYGCVQRRLTLDFYLKPFIQNPKKLDDWVEELLKLSIYQFVYLDKVPDHAVLNEAVEIAKRYGNVGIGKFVNGVLRNVQRKELPSFDSIKDTTERLSVEGSMPVWLIQKLEKQYGRNETREIVLSLLQPPRISARVNTFTLSRQEVIEELSKNGTSVRESEVSPFGIVAEKGNLTRHPLFQQGVMTMQDESSMLVAPTLQIEPHHKVLDVCAAPGGKTTHIAMYLDENLGGKVTALDIYSHKIKLIEENAERLNVSNRVITKQMDARDVQNEFPPESFDRILVDAPCSGLGLMRRKPDIKYQKNLTDFEELNKIQQEILNSVATCLKKNGIITYSTCTIVEEENEKVVEAFLRNHPNFEKIEVSVSGEMKELVQDGMLQILPHQKGTDGFFISCFKKTER